MASPLRILPGRPGRLGAHWDGRGVDFALFSANATKVELCLFDAPDAAFEAERIALAERTGDIWHVRVEGLDSGQLYAYRVHGPWEPDEGHLFNPRKLLVDPYSRALCGELRWDESLLGYAPSSPDEPSADDSAPFVPRGVVVEPTAAPPERDGPSTPWTRTVIYECHVKGATVRHEGVAASERGRFAGLASEPFVRHLRELGVTAVELLPVQQTGLDGHLAALGLPNYWGYSTLGFFAPDTRFASADRGEQIEEFRRMVAGLHAAGIEVILDVVYNHSPEGGPQGPTLSLRGIDNASYYRLQDEDASRYTDVTGCGNSLNTAHPRMRQLILDSLRYWAGELGVDGFRFDLASALARDPDHFQEAGRFFELVHQDPVLSRCKLIAEPWDLGPEGYRLGRFPSEWSEWNDRFRDCVRRFWRGDAGQLPELAGRVLGSRDLFGWNGRGCAASVNYVCSHDGFCLEDLVSYARKHNEANGEGGSDGAHDESHNWGHEGPSRDRRVVRVRERAKRNLAMTSLLSLGTPMWLGGDELSRTQGGNNNTYCQDNETSWFDWRLDARERDFLEFVKRCLALRRENAIFRRRRYLDGEESGAVLWLRRDGTPLRQADWDVPARRAFTLRLDASIADPVDEAGTPQSARSVAWLMNGHPRIRNFVLPEPDAGCVWIEVLSSACDVSGEHVRSGRVRLAPHSTILLESREAE